MSLKRWAESKPKTAQIAPQQQENVQFSDGPMSESFEEWEARRIYSVVCNHRDGKEFTETVVASGLAWDAATAKQTELQDAEKLANPGKSCWTIDIFTIQLDTPWVPFSKRNATTTKGEN